MIKNVHNNQYYSHDDHNKYLNLLNKAISGEKYYRQRNILLLDEFTIAKKRDNNSCMNEHIMSKYLFENNINCENILMRIKSKDNCSSYNIISKIQGKNLTEMILYFEDNYNQTNGLRKKHILDLYRIELLKILELKIIPIDFDNLGNAIYNQITDTIYPIDYQYWRFGSDIDIKLYDEKIRNIHYNLRF
jgi:hypothetical protein